MTDIAFHRAQSPATMVRGTYGRCAFLPVFATFGGSGAVSSYAGSAAGVVVAKSAGTGIYTITPPTGRKVMLVGEPVYIQASGVTNHWTVTSIDATTGVVTLTLGGSATGTHAAADATSGDMLQALLAVLD